MSSTALQSYINPLRTVDGYSRSLRDATGPVDLYSRIVHMCTCTHAHMHTCTLHNSAYLHVHEQVVVKSLITSTWVRHGSPLSWPHSHHLAIIPPSVHNINTVCKGLNREFKWKQVNLELQIYSFILSV